MEEYHDNRFVVISKLGIIQGYGKVWYHPPPEINGDRVECVLEIACDLEKGVGKGSSLLLAHLDPDRDTDIF